MWHYIIKHHVVLVILHKCDLKRYLVKPKAEWHIAYTYSIAKEPVSFPTTHGVTCQNQKVPNISHPVFICSDACVSSLQEYNRERMLAGSEIVVPLLQIAIIT